MNYTRQMKFICMKLYIRNEVDLIEERRTDVGKNIAYVLFQINITMLIFSMTVWCLRQRKSRKEKENETRKIAVYNWRQANLPRRMKTENWKNVFILSLWTNEFRISSQLYNTTTLKMSTISFMLFSFFSLNYQLQISMRMNFKSRRENAIHVETSQARNVKCIWQHEQSPCYWT